MLGRLLEKTKVVKLEICTLKGKILLTVSKNYTFPFKLTDTDRYGRSDTGQTVIIKDKNLPVFARNAPVKVVAHTRSGDRVSYPGRVDMSMERQLNIYLRTEAAETLDERRRFYKIAEEIPCLVVSIMREDILTDFEEPISFMIGDINIGGVFLNANARVEFSEQDAIEIILNSPVGETRLTAKVLRVQRTPEGEIKGYGCCFLFLNSGQEEAVAGFINKIQMDRRKLELQATVNDDVPVNM
ncbi:MAG: PilZ domain-containing protein [Oscillospiraceae bacterium]|nr:PilZ domain-containing protein [Oscillospiraceae bacterium]